MTNANTDELQRRKYAQFSNAQKLAILEDFLASGMRKANTYEVAKGLPKSALINFTKHYARANNMFGATVLDLLRNKMITLDDISAHWKQKGLGAYVLLEARVDALAARIAQLEAKL